MKRTLVTLISILICAAFFSGCKTDPKIDPVKVLDMTSYEEEVSEELCPNDIYIDNWNNSLTISKEMFTNVKPGDTLIFKATYYYDGSSSRIYVMNENWNNIKLDNITCTPAPEYVEQGWDVEVETESGNTVTEYRIFSKFKFNPYDVYTFTITFTENDLVQLRERGLLFSGESAVIKSAVLNYKKNVYKSSKTFEQQYAALASYRKQVVSQFVKSNKKLPVIYITTDNMEDVKKKEYYTSIIDIENVDSQYKLPSELSKRRAGVKVRGNSTASDEWSPNYKPYRIKFEKKNSMLGLHDGKKYKSWVLLKASGDIAADYLGFNLAHEIYKTSSYSYYASDCAFVHVIMNGDYKGMYLLCEQNQVNEDRVDVYENEDGNPSAKVGYMIELDNYAWEDLKDGYGRWFGDGCSQGKDEYHFSLDYRTGNPEDDMVYEDWDVHVGLKFTDVNGLTRAIPGDDFSLKNDIYNDDQVSFIKKYMRGVWEISYAAIEKGQFLKFDEDYNVVPAPEYTSAKQACGAVVDLESLVNEMILEELVRDNDVGAGSLYMAVDFTVPKGHKYNKLTFECPWDFNWAYNNYNQDNAFYNGKLKYFAGAWQPMYVIENDNYERSNAWFMLYNKAPWFREMQRQKWNQIGSANLRNFVSGLESKLKRPLVEGSGGAYCINFVKDRITYIDKYLWK